MAQAPVRQSRAEKKAETRERLLKAAETIARDQGFARVTLEAVASAAGLTKGAIYSNFGSKEELILDVLQRLTPGLNLTAEVEDARDLRTLLQRTAVLIAAGARSKAKQVALASEFDALALRDPALRKAIKAATARERAADPEDAEDWFRERGIDLPVPAKWWALAVSMLGAGLLTRRILLGEAEVPDAFIVWALGRFDSSQ